MAQLKNTLIAGDLSVTGSILGTNIGSNISFSKKLIAQQAINQIITGTGTAAVDAGSGNSPRYTPARWTFNVSETLQDGDTFLIKIPVAGHSCGIYMSVDNGVTYHPVTANTTARLQTNYPVGICIHLVFESTGSCVAYAFSGSDSTSTVTGGVFRVINYYDSNTNTLLRTYKAYATNVELPLVGMSTGSTSPAALSGETSYSDSYGQIPKTTANRATYNLSTGKITVPGGLATSKTASATTDIPNLSQVQSLISSIANATTTTAGLMSATDKTNLDTLMADYTSAMTALGI